MRYTACDSKIGSAGAGQSLNLNSPPNLFKLDCNGSPQKRCVFGDPEACGASRAWFKFRAHPWHPSIFETLLVYLLLFIFVQMLNASDYSLGKQTICLNMIVKNESDVIERCLNSVKPVIDYWVIVDTGSTDATKEIIQRCLEGIPGKLWERPWKNFGDNRSEAFELAKSKADYILFIDADDVLEFEGQPGFGGLTEDQYIMWSGTKDFTYLKPQLVKADLAWKWIGVTHEYLTCDRSYSSSILENVKYVTLSDGANSKNGRDKFLKNVQLLEEGLQKEPNNRRYVFYLAESYRDAGDKEKALMYYQKRIQMGGWAEEVFWSLLQSAHMMREIGFSSPLVIEGYQKAHLFRPFRVEPIYYIAEMYNQEGNYLAAYEYLKRESLIPKPPQKDSLFNMEWIRRYGLLFQLSICSYFVGEYEESLNTCDQLLQIADLPESWREQIEENRLHPLNKLAPR